MKDYSITLFGTCRIANINHHNNLNNIISYVHNTKEVIQLINFLNGNLKLNDPYNKYCFRTGIIENKNIEFSNTYKDLFDKSNIAIIEICSMKKYIHNNYYLHHLCVDERFSEWNISDIKNKFHIEKQTDQEIENDLLEIHRILADKKIIIVSHYNCIAYNKFFSDRYKLIKLLENICKKHNMNFINPTEALKKYSQNEILQNDFGHYTDFGIAKFTEYLNKYIKDFYEISA